MVTNVFLNFPVNQKNDSWLQKFQIMMQGRQTDECLQGHTATPLQLNPASIYVKQVPTVKL